MFEMYLPDGHTHLDQECQREKTRKQAENDGDAAEEFRASGKIGHPARKSKRADHVGMVMKTAENFGVSMSDHDRSKNEAQHQQGEGLQFIERIHGCLRGKGSRVRS